MDKEERNLYFIRSNGEYRLLAKKVDRVTASKIMHEFLDYHNYNSRYTRIWETDEGVMYDVGSWSEFFLWGEHIEEKSEAEEGDHS